MPDSLELHSNEALAAILRRDVDNPATVVRVRTILVERAERAWEKLIEETPKGHVLGCLARENLGLGRYVEPNPEHVKNGFIWGWLTALGA